MHSEFSKEREKARQRGDFKKNRDQEIFDREIKGYSEWITHAGYCDNMSYSQGRRHGVD